VTDLNTNDRYKVDGFGGVAFYFAGVQTETHTIWEYDEDDPGTCWEVSSEEEPTGMVYMIMVGDDHKHVIDPDDITKIDDDDYCHECGQIGCTADGR
jgi:hypothetical protein